MKPMATADLRKLLRSKDCVEGGGKGSHEKWTSPEGYSTTLKAGVKEQAPGTLRNIQAALAPDLGEDWIEEAR